MVGFKLHFGFASLEWSCPRHTIDSFYRDDEVGEKAHPANGSYARIPNGSGNWVIVTNASRNELNPEDAEIVEQDMFEDTDSDDSGDDEE